MQCWKPQEPPFGGNVCIPLSAFHLDAWTTAWDNKTATQFTPPSTPEFWKLKESKMRSRGKTASATPEPTPLPTNSTTSAPAPVTANVTVKLDKSMFGAKDSPVKTREPPFKRCVSPITEYPAAQWIDSGLIDFLEYCATKYNDQCYMGYWRTLAKQRLGIDLYKAATIDSAKAQALADSLRDYVEVPSGTIQRWLDDFEEWYAIIKGTVVVSSVRVEE
jgi:hypothetical protein